MPLKAKTNRRENSAKEAALEEVAKEEMVRLNLNVPTSLRQRLKLQAVKEERDMSEIMTELLEGYLDRTSSSE